MKKKVKILAVLAGALFAALLFAETPKAPVLSDALKLKFFKAQNEAIQTSDTARQAAQAAQQAEVEYQGVAKELAYTCGKDFQPQIDPKTKDPECVAKPQVPTPTKK